MNIYEVCQAWLEAKELEERAKKQRRLLEDMLIPLFGFVSKITTDTFDIHITRRTEYKINQAVLEQLAQENGLTEHLIGLFRWRPELNQKAWEASDKSITDPLLPAITAQHGRPTFQIMKKSKDEKEIN